MNGNGNGRMALVFPGQGCQYVGMGADIYREFPQARRVYDRADEALGFPLSKLCFEGPEDALNDTANTQPAIYVTTMALWEVLSPRLEEIKPRVRYAAGHSLGEWIALAIVGALEFEDGLRLVRRRGEAMRDAGTSAPGGMGVIIGLSDEAVGEIVDQINGDEQEVWIANYNSPGQVVIAGTTEALKRALALAKESKAKYAIPLPVSVACHTPLMADAVDALRPMLEDTIFHHPWVPVVSNATALPLSDPADLKEALLQQLTSPVRWVESVQVMVAGQVASMLEVGPKAVISTLVKRIDRGIAFHGVTDLPSLERFDVEALKN